jgi:hypothetical protein
MKNRIKAAWVAAMLGLSALTVWDLYYEHERKQALAHQLREIELQTQHQIEVEKQRSDQYLREVEAWRQLVQGIEQTNRERIRSWERRMTQQRVLPSAPPPPPVVIEGPDGEPVVAAAIPAPIPRVEVPRPTLETIPPPPEPPQPTVIEISAADGIRIELQKDTSWQSILQLLVLILVTYGGIKTINRFTENPSEA